MPALFLASATASAASILELVGVSKQEHGTVTAFSIAGKAAEFASAALLERNVASVPEAVRPLREGFSGMLWKTGKALSTASFVLSLVPKPSPRLRKATGILAIRYRIHYAGDRSAINPRATFHQQRQGQGAFEIGGKAAVVGPNDVWSFEPTR